MGGCDGGPLARGWRQHQSPEGVPFYVHAASGRSVWSRAETATEVPDRAGSEVPSSAKRPRDAAKLCNPSAAAEATTPPSDDAEQEADGTVSSRAPNSSEAAAGGACKTEPEVADGEANRSSEVEDVTLERQAEKRQKLLDNAVDLVSDGTQAVALASRRKAAAAAESQVEQAVEELSEERKRLQAQLSSKDAILDPRCKDLLSRWLSGEGEEASRMKKPGWTRRAADHAIDMLSSGYEGYGEYVGKLIEWIDLLNTSTSAKGAAGAVNRLAIGGASTLNGTGNHGAFAGPRLTPLPGSGSTNNGAKQPSAGDEAATAHFKQLAMKEFTPQKVLDVIENGGERPPDWLVDMLDAPEWRHLVINLADKHKNVPMLDFCVKAICKAGKHAEVAQVMNTASYFAVFRRTFTDTLHGILEFDISASAGGDSSLTQLNKLEERFCELAGYSQYTYMFAMEALEVLEGVRLEGTLLPAGSSQHTGLIDLAVKLTPGTQSKIRRLRQGLENMPRSTGKDKPGRAEALILCNPINRRSAGGLSASAASGGAPELAGLIRSFTAERALNPATFGQLRRIYDPECNPMADSVPIWPIRRTEFLTELTRNLFDPFCEVELQARRDASYLLAVAAARGGAGALHERKVLGAIEEALDICKDKDTLTVNGLARDSDQVQRLVELVREFPPVSAGIVRFARSLFLSAQFQAESCFTIGVHTFLYLVRCAMQAHPLQRVMGFFFIIHSLPIAPRHIIAAKLLDIKQAMLDELLALMQFGFVFQVLELIRNQASSGQLDHVLVRYFALQLAKTAGPPFSPEFAKAALQLINSDACVRAIRLAHNKEATRIISEFRTRCTAAAAGSTPAVTSAGGAGLPAAVSGATAATGAPAGSGRAVIAPLTQTNKNRHPLGGSSAAPQRVGTIRLVPFKPHGR